MRWLCLVVVAGMLDVGGADASPEAVQLFREGRALLEQGQLEAACDRFERSQRLAPKVGTLLNLGECLARRGLTASAWAAFSEAKALAAQTGDRRREGEAQRRAAALEPDLAYLSITADVAIPGLVIRRNGIALEPAAWNAMVPVDPGDYVLAAEAPGRIPWSRDVTVEVGRRVAVNVELAMEAVAPGPHAADPAPIAATAPNVPIHAVGAGVLVGANTREHPFVGGRVVANLPVPHGLIRGVLSGLYSRYEDPGDAAAMEPAHTVDTFIASAGIEYVRLLLPQLAVAAGAGLGVEIDSGLQVDVGGALAGRASPAIVRLAGGRLEAGLHVQLVVASDEVRFEMFAGADWFFR